VREGALIKGKKRKKKICHGLHGSKKGGFKGKEKKKKRFYHDSKAGG